MKNARLVLMLFLVSASLTAQDAVRHFSAGAEASLGMAGIADFSSADRFYGPIAGASAGLFASRYFSDPAYFELGCFGSRRGNRIRDVNTTTPDLLDYYPTYRLWYLDLPFRLYYRVGKSRNSESFLFMGFTTSFLVKWEAALPNGEELAPSATPDDLSYSLSYGLAFEHGAFRWKIYANMALKSLSATARDVYGVAYVPFEILAGMAYKLN